MEILCSYHFVEVAPVPSQESNESRGYRLNRCVHSWLMKHWKMSSAQHFGAVALDCLINHAFRYDGTERQAVCYRMFPHLEHVLNLPLHGFLNDEDHYLHAQQTFKLGRAFFIASRWLSAPFFSALVNFLVIRRPAVAGIANFKRCAQKVILLCDRIQEQRFQKLNIEAFGEMVYLHTMTGSFEVFETILRRIRACRAPFHPNEVLCVGCFSFLTKYIIVVAFNAFSAAFLAWVIYSMFATLGWRDLPEVIVRQAAQLGIQILLSASLMEGKYRAPTLVLSVALVIVCQTVDLFARDIKVYHFHNFALLALRFQYMFLCRMAQSKSQAERTHNFILLLVMQGCLMYIGFNAIRSTWERL